MPVDAVLDVMDRHRTHSSLASKRPRSKSSRRSGTSNQDRDQARTKAILERLDGDFPTGFGDIVRALEPRVDRPPPAARGLSWISKSSGSWYALIMT